MKDSACRKAIATRAANRFDRLRRWRDSGDEVLTGYEAGNRDFADDVIALLNEHATLRARIAELEEALETVKNWGPFPKTGEYWDKARVAQMTYHAAFGSNGERDYMRGIAATALAGASLPKTEGVDEAWPTDADVERAARTHFLELAERSHINARPWDEQDESDRADWLAGMRVALIAAKTGETT